MINIGTGTFKNHKKKYFSFWLWKTEYYSPQASKKEEKNY